MKKLLFLFVTMLFFAISCNKDDTQPPDNQLNQFSFEITPDMINSQLSTEPLMVTNISDLKSVSSYDWTIGTVHCGYQAIGISAETLAWLLFENNYSFFTNTLYTHAKVTSVNTPNGSGFTFPSCNTTYPQNNNYLEVNDIFTFENYTDTHGQPQRKILEISDLPQPTYKNFFFYTPDKVESFVFSFNYVMKYNGSWQTNQRTLDVLVEACPFNVGYTLQIISPAAGYMKIFTNDVQKVYVTTNGANGTFSTKVGDEVTVEVYCSGIAMSNSQFLHGYGIYYSTEDATVTAGWDSQGSTIYGTIVPLE